MATRHAELLRLRSTLADLDSTQRQLEESADDAPFVIYLTERMLRDIDACRKACQTLKGRAAWPSLN